MAVNLFPPENLLPVDGVRLSAVSAGIRYQGRDDLVLMELAEGSQCAAVFTKNAFCAAPVIVARDHLAVASPRYLLINSGNANAGTGEQGLQTAKATCVELAKLLDDCQAESVLPFSTGVIGEQLPLECFQNTLPSAIGALASDHWAQAAAGIMTTDTVAKAISRQVELDGGVVTITGVSKGSGMIHPNMATMLAYVATDAMAGQDTLQSLLTEVTNETFNCITVDGDTSTNDALILAATGQSGVPIAGANLVVFRQALQEVCLYLAQAIVRDGEGATKFISIDVEDAGSRDEARAVGETVALSPLVKTAMFASDPNWGRILAAIGRSPVENLDVSKVTVWLGDTLLVENGQPAASYTEEQGQQVMKRDEITVRISLGRGDTKASTWTCDFSYDYVKINAEYRS
ncbi:MAG: Glutamate N-acetyltransferase (EC / N-acetylglutamate synthase (EC [uncultured Thiotrichaceae bacterium]|uniref:Arginine biosynthesis bifunctional protein ArgJ n=1 Tax=uncultured Thiotrichaceae bacterium TaxID=298394 RepID=A0A6S6SFU2_9GAMM|nr:MAG: Glutamate N-acetyltransferase (EC / N-acetylglutamate synthase (EC [uncultured Thiotrichaceae bacterium]